MAPDDLVGIIFGARFRVLRPLGIGGMGAVYVAVDEDGHQVALKVIRQSLADSTEANARFEREAAALSELSHENIVKFLAVGQDGDARWMAMELLEGKTLKERIHSRGSMPWQETLPILRGVARALEAAHGRGLIHRDLKPENVMLVDGGVVKLLDFGVAKHTALPEGMTMTGTGIIVGTPGFVAPEVVLYGTNDDVRSDFYGLGATWFEMLTGTKPFDAATPFALAMRHVNEKPPRPTDLRPFSPVPLPVEALLFRLLAKTPDGRPTNATVLLEELARLEQAAISGVDFAASVDKTLTDMRTPVVTPSTQVAAFPEPVVPGKQDTNRKVMLAAGAVAAIALVVLAVSVLVPSPRVATVPPFAPSLGKNGATGLIHAGDAGVVLPIIIEPPAHAPDAGMLAVDAGPEPHRHTATPTTTTTPPATTPKKDDVAHRPELLLDAPPK